MRCGSSPNGWMRAPRSRRCGTSSPSGEQESRTSEESFRFFNFETPFRSKNFELKLGRTPNEKRHKRRNVMGAAPPETSLAEVEDDGGF